MSNVVHISFYPKFQIWIINSHRSPTKVERNGLYENKYLNRRSSRLLHRRKVGHWHSRFCITEEKVRLVSKIHWMTWNGVILKPKQWQWSARCFFSIRNLHEHADQYSLAGQRATPWWACEPHEIPDEQCSRQQQTISNHSQQHRVHRKPLDVGRGQEVCPHLRDGSPHEQKGGSPSWHTAHVQNNLLRELTHTSLHTKTKNHKIHQHPHSLLPTSRGNDSMSHEMGRKKTICG